MVPAVAMGLFEQGFVPVARGDTLIKIRAERVVVAAGAIEQPLVFPGNDLVGVMLPDGVRRLVNLWSIRPADRAFVVTADDRGREEAARFGIRFLKQPLTRDNYKHVLDPLVGRGDFVLNVSVDVSSVAMIKYCWEKGALYLDTVVEPWAGGYTDNSIPLARRTNYAMREEALALRKDPTPKPTAVTTHGANPGLETHVHPPVAAPPTRPHGLPSAPSLAQCGTCSPRRPGIPPDFTAVRPGGELHRASSDGRQNPGAFSTWSNQSNPISFTMRLLIMISRACSAAKC